KQGVYVKHGILCDALNEETEVIGDLSEARCLNGKHNWQNAAAAYAVCVKLGLKPEQVFQAIFSFPGLVHRQELVADINGVQYVNDSKATNSDAAIRALQSFEKIHWIAGGRAKEASFVGMLHAANNVKQAYFIGEAGTQFSDDLKSIPNQVFVDLEEAFNAAVINAEEGDTILLSPACTAFDQFSDFEKRGKAFKELVRAHEGINS
ncbi:MAG: glutamate ligase domain-containing protein, partial [Kordiimonas sp.]